MLKIEKFTAIKEPKIISFVSNLPMNIWVEYILHKDLGCQICSDFTVRTEVSHSKFKRLMVFGDNTLIQSHFQSGMQEDTHIITTELFAIRIEMLSLTSFASLNKHVTMTWVSISPFKINMNKSIEHWGWYFTMITERWSCRGVTSHHLMVVVLGGGHTYCRTSLIGDISGTCPGFQYHKQD